MLQFRKKTLVFLSSVILLTVWNLALAITGIVDQDLNQVIAPKIVNPAHLDKPVVIAIVDDGVRIKHQAISDFIWRNPAENRVNNIDDDGNGHIDDLHGWDVADDNNHIEPPADRLAEYYHGTRLAGIIARVARRAYAQLAPEYIRIMPVKAMSDQAEQAYIKSGYKGIQYAIDAGADIILCSWGVGHISPEEQSILEKARARGVLIVASVANVPQELEQFPAAYPSVLAVTAVDKTGHKASQASYGQYVDIAADGDDIYSADVASDNSYIHSSGSSYSTALVAAAAALVKSVHPSFSGIQIKACLVNAASVWLDTDKEFAGKLGAGNLNIAAALKCDVLTGAGGNKTDLIATRAYINLRNNKRKRSSWLIHPQGKFKGLRLRTHSLKHSAGKGTLKIYTGAIGQEQLFAEYASSNIPENIYIPETRVLLVLESKRKKLDTGLLLAYQMETINYTTLFCKGQKQVNHEMVIDDGSGENNYSAASDCKWLITAPKDKLIQLEFTEFDTEAKTDFIYFFDGAGTQADIIARFSGPDIPPVLSSWHNQMLVWFVSNRSIEGAGWKAEVRFVDKEK